jgi:Glycosyl transferase family 2
MLITVAVCTRNRARSLARTLAALAAMAPPGCAWEMLVIDNASTDDTRAVVAGFSGRLPSLRCEGEPRPGISHARNRAVAAARGGHIAWTDDDVVVDRGWLASYARAFARWPEAALFGGRITPVLLPPAAAWMRDNLALLGHLLAARDFGPAPLPLTMDRLPYGANCAVRTEAQRRFAYDPTLGPAPGQRRGHDETAAFEAMLAAGCTGWWVPDSRVEHMIGPERQTPHYVRRYFAAAGETEAHRHGTAGVRLLGVPRWLWRRVLGGRLCYRLARLTAPPEVWLPHLIALAHAEGTLRYWWRADGPGKPQPPRLQ